MNLDQYEFGTLVADGREIHSDVLITPAGAQERWRRREGPIACRAGRCVKPPLWGLLALQVVSSAGVTWLWRLTAAFNVVVGAPSSSSSTSCACRSVRP